VKIISKVILFAVNLALQNSVLKYRLVIQLSHAVKLPLQHINNNFVLQYTVLNILQEENQAAVT